MPSFSYEAISRDGSRQSGVLDCADAGTASRLLSRRGLTPLKIRSDGPARPPVAKARRARDPVGSSAAAASRTPATSDPANAPGRRVSRKTVIRFLGLALRLHKGGYSIGDTVKALRSRLRIPADQVFAAAVWEEIAEGKNFSEALGAAGAPLPDSLLQMIRAGEATGNLAPVLGDLVEHLHNVDSVRKEVLGSLAYPAFLVTFSLAVGGFLVGFMMPKIRDLTTTLGGEPSFFTKLLGSLTSIFVYAIPLGLLAVILSSVAFALLRRNPSGRFRTDRWLLRLPLVGQLIRQIEIHRLASLLGSLIRNGVSTSQALLLAEPTLRNLELRERFSGAREGIFEGAAVSRSLIAAGILEDVEGDLLEASEAGGHLDEGFVDLGATLHATVARRTRLIVNGVAAGALAFAFGLITLVALSMVTSIFQVTRTLNQ